MRVLATMSVGPDGGDNSVRNGMRVFVATRGRFLAAVATLALLLTACNRTPWSTPGERGVAATPAAPSDAKSIDDFVFGRLRQLKLEPAPDCSDEVFFRRVNIDVLGTLPTADEAARFFADPSKVKRRVLVDELLKREEFADYWTMKWGDLLRIKAEFPINLWPNAAQAYTRYVRTSIAQNKPYDQFARELLISNGSNFRVGQVNFYRAMQNRTPEGIAVAVALTFMGTRADKWPESKLADMAVCFSKVGYKPTREWKEQIVFWDPAKTVPSADMKGPNDATKAVAPKAPLEAVLPDGTRIRIAADRDPRVAFADWLIAPKNEWFARSIANRVWAWLMGRGLVHEADDIRPDNPPSHPELLAFLERELVTHRYDLRHLYRLILNSRAYQLSAQGQSPGPAAELNFASYPLRRLEAEVFIDAINKVTGTYDLYTSAIPEPFTYIPKDIPAIALADGSITSSFLALFGRSARATGEESERVSKVLPGQLLHLLNSTHIQNKIEKGPGLKAVWDSKRSDREKLDRLYLTILSRLPTNIEARTAMAYCAPGSSGSQSRESWTDLAWALINSDEFLFRH